MAMSAGSVTVSSAGWVSGSGCAKALYDDFFAKFPDIPSGADGVAAKQQLADLCNSMAKVIDYIKTNGEVTVTVSASDDGLQLMPATTTEDTPCKAPGSPVTLSEKGTIG